MLRRILRSAMPTLNPIEHVIYKLRNAKLNLYPYPHFYVDYVFPKDFYEALLDSLPPEEEYRPLKGGYLSRKATEAKVPLAEQFNTPMFGREVMMCFEHQFFDRFPDQYRPHFRQELRFIRDSE